MSDEDYAALLPGDHYGSDVPLNEQLRRMSEDARRWREYSPKDVRRKALRDAARHIRSRVEAVRRRNRAACRSNDAVPLVSVVKWANEAEKL